MCYACVLYVMRAVYVMCVMMCGVCCVVLYGVCLYVI